MSQLWVKLGVVDEIILRQKWDVSQVIEWIFAIRSVAIIPSIEKHLPKDRIVTDPTTIVMNWTLSYLVYLFWGVAINPQKESFRAVHENPASEKRVKRRRAQESTRVAVRTPITTQGPG